MTLIEMVRYFINKPYPLWEYEVTDALVNKEWVELKKSNIISQRDYSTERCIGGYNIPIGNRIPVSDSSKDEIIYLECASFDYLRNFYDEHGLYPCTEDDIESDMAETKVKKAMDVLGLEKPVYSCIAKLVRSIQILKKEDEEIDVSYSHPKIPFSIFVSICQDNSTLSSLRVAESILHETMHLKLTLIENAIELLKPNTGNLYFSPWREEKRPAQGVLHGLFVFRAILDFYDLVTPHFLEDTRIFNYLDYRSNSIKSEIRSLKDFQLAPDLTREGNILAINLLRF